MNANQVKVKIGLSKKKHLQVFEGKKYSSTAELVIYTCDFCMFIFDL